MVQRGVAPAAPYPNPTHDVTAQLRMQIAEMQRSREAKPIFLAGTYCKPKVPYDACASTIVNARLPYDLNVIMGRRKANDASPILPNPADAIPKMIAAASAKPAAPLHARAHLMY